MNTFNRIADEGAAAIQRCQLPVSNHFPATVRDALVAASLTFTDFDPMARVKAINRATERAQLMFPHLFKN